MQEKVLILSFSGIGNGLMAVPFLNCLKEKIAPRAIDILCLNEPMVEAFNLTFEGAEVFCLTGRRPADLFTILALRKRRYDLCITLFPSNKWQFDVIAFLSGAKRRISHQYPVNRLSAFLQNVKIPANTALHDIQQNLNLLKALSFEPPQGSTPVNVKLGWADKKFARDFIEDHKLGGAFIVGVHPGAGSDYGGQGWQGKFKRWGEENFAGLCDALIEEKNARVILFGGKSEAALKNEIYARARCRDKIIPSYTATLFQAAALMAQCNLFISNDSGLMHLAAFSRVPTLGIFGPTNHNRTAPWGQKSFYLRAQTECSPCLKYPFYSTFSRLHCRFNAKCFYAVSVEMVMNFLKAKGLI